jgi:hypothetical protein
VQVISDCIFIALALLPDLFQIQPVLKELVPGLFFEDAEPAGAEEDVDIIRAIGEGR